MSVTGGDYIKMICRGVESEAKPFIKEMLIDDLMPKIESELQDFIDEQLSDLVFDIKDYSNSEI